VTGTLGGKAAQWTTYDYSVGAFDAAVQIRGQADAPEFHRSAQPPGKTEGRTGELRMQGLIGKSLKAGVMTGALDEIGIGETDDHPRYSSYGQSAEIVLDEVVDTEGPMGYGHLKGHFSAHMCVARGGDVPVVNLANCKDVAGRFESDFQYDVYNAPHG
jgi:hypothetical protein